MIDRACVSISGHCNLRCSYCHFRGEGEEYEDMTISQARRIMDNMIEYAEVNGVEKFKVGLLGAGEPLLRFDLIKDIVNYSRKSDIFSFYTITNGTIVSNEILSFFDSERERIELNFSLDGHQELHDLCRKTRNGAGTHDVVMGAINRYGSIFGVKPNINCTVNAKTIENKDMLFGFLKANGFNRVSFSRMVGALHLGLNITTASFDGFLSEAMDQGFIMRQSSKKDSYDCTMYGRKCGVGRTNIFYSGGKIFPCGRFVRLDDYILGQYDTPLHEVEENMRMLRTSTPDECYYDSMIVERRADPIIMAHGPGEAF